ncbi:DDE-type integrase/transposase/recombinase [uncultured Stenotrophomonas sp.]|uniref:DDE-type integrase/transposase/recombinase n=1 Tax=uncultured Stenotrophomonas sp. TaxID=165438 RepID=UPI0025DC6AD1|nr:DDE-type integrase/transposase/recombinase [uncultured Stenotrophomonas sp.]
MIEAEPSFGYRTVAALLRMNKNTVQRIFQLKGWQVRKRALGQRPRIEAKVSRAELPDQRWATDLCRVWGGKDGWLSLALVIDCHTRQLLGWHLSRTGRASTASAALEQALITRYGALGRVRDGLSWPSRKCQRKRGRTPDQFTNALRRLPNARSALAGPYISHETSSIFR